eukprot:gb/GECG01000597.1/.p1 GENE.gb/GECG01000597.1/~~gb/GECG01000597.1/.p1  ORF type:complete len:140 (+),score=5.98 gb/GECG01000597.1/:1-420(+)
MEFTLYFIHCLQVDYNTPDERSFSSSGTSSKHANNTHHTHTQLVASAFAGKKDFLVQSRSSNAYFGGSCQRQISSNSTSSSTGTRLVRGSSQRMALGSRLPCSQSRSSNVVHCTSTYFGGSSQRKSVLSVRPLREEHAW